MLEVKLDVLENSIEATRSALQDSILSINIWDRQTGLTLIDWQGNPTAVALLSQMTQELNDTLDNSGFPQLKDYYYMDLEDDQSLVVLDHGNNLMEGWLIDSEKRNDGVLLAIAIPKALSMAQSARVDR